MEAGWMPKIKALLARDDWDAIVGCERATPASIFS